MRPSTQVLEAAAKLQSTETKAFVEWMEEERDETLEHMSVAKPEIISILQGKAQALKQILDLVKTSRDVLEKTR